MIKLWLLRLGIFSISFVLVTCRKQAYDPLPPATQIGNGTFACRINGEVWESYSSDFKRVSQGARYLEKDKTLFIGGFNDRKQQGVGIGLANYTGQVGVYQLDSICLDLPRICANDGHYTTSKYLEPAATFFTSSHYKGKVEITKHTGGGIVSGTFEFEAQNRKTGEIVKITDGRFDMGYREY